MIGLFDVDGTILDSMGIYENLGSVYLKSKGMKAHQGLNDVLYPMTFDQSAAYLKDYYQIDDSVDHIIQSLQACLYHYYQDEVLLKEGIVDVLDMLNNKNYSLYIISSSPQKLIDISFQRLKIHHYFKNIYTCDDLKINKDNQQFYQKIINMLHVEASECIVFEDNVYSALAAKQCRIKVVGIQDDYARGNIEKIADIYIKNWRDLDENSFNDCR